MDHYAYYQKKKNANLFDTEEHYASVRARRAIVYKGIAIRGDGKHIVGWDLLFPIAFASTAVRRAT